MGSRVLFQSLAVQNIEGGAGKGKKPALLKSLPQCRLFEDHMERRKSVLNGESGGMKMDNIRIRQADMDDLDGVTLVEARCFPPAEAAGREVFEKRLGTFPESFFIAEDQGKLIGFINGCATDEKTIRDEMFEDCGLHKADGAYQSVFGLDVVPEYRNRGIAAQLMDYLIEDAGKRGRKGLILTCKDRMIHYYEKFGYVNLGVSESVHGGAVWYDMLLEL